jgi:hypothetical protein
MANAVIKKYACDHNELLNDRISYVANDIETFLSMAFISPAAATTLVFNWLLSAFFLHFSFFLLIGLEHNHSHRQ